MSLEQEYRDAKGKLVDFETRIKKLESDNRQSNQALGFILQLQREQVVQSHRMYGWLAALFDTLSADSSLGQKPQAYPFDDQGALPAVCTADAVLPNIDGLILKLKR